MSRSAPRWTALYRTWKMSISGSAIRCTRVRLCVESARRLTSPRRFNSSAASSTREGSGRFHIPSSSTSAYSNVSDRSARPRLHPSSDPAGEYDWITSRYLSRGRLRIAWPNAAFRKLPQ